MLVRAVLISVIPIGAHAQTVTAILQAGPEPNSSAVNPITNKIYVANFLGASVTVINGATNNTTLVSVGSEPDSVAINPVTDKIYVANFLGASVTVIDGATNSTQTVGVGSQPVSIAINPVTNQVYVANYLSATVTVIDGITNNTKTIPAGIAPSSVGVNVITNKIYIANSMSSTVTVIEGATNSATTLAAGSQPVSVAINPVTNQIYVANSADGTVTVIDGATNSTQIITVGSQPISLAVNPATNKIYVVNNNSADVTVIDGHTNSTITVAVGADPYIAAVNPVTSQIYIVNYDAEEGSAVTAIDGLTNTATSVATGGSFVSVAINPVTNKVYVGKGGSFSVSNGTILVVDGATDSTAIVATGTNPAWAAVNPATNKTYIANYGSNNVTVIDGNTGSISTVPTGTNPVFLVVNPVTNKIYVANQGSNSVTIIDGPTNATTNVPAGTAPWFVAVNPVTNKIYVANQLSNNLTVIDGPTDATTTVPAGTTPWFVAVNPVTDRIYVANQSSNNLTVIDGGTNSTTTIATGLSPYSVAVNPETNRIYVANQGNANVTVIDGATNSTATIAAGSSPCSVAVNPVTNKIYVVNEESASVTVIDGATNITTTIPAGSSPYFVAVNPVTNKIYVADVDPEASNVTVIDGATNSTWAIAVGQAPRSLAVNLITNQIYVVNSENTATVISEQHVQPVPLTTIIDPLTGNQTSSLTPLFTFSATSTFSPTATTPDNVYFQVDTWQNAWNSTTGSGTSYTGMLASLQPGFHLLYAYAVDGQQATATQAGSVLIGSIQAYGFVATQTPQTIIFDAIPEQIIGTALALGASATSGLAVSYSSSTPSVCVISGASASFIGDGTCTVTASQGGNNNFLSATSVSQMFGTVPLLSINTAALAAGTVATAYSAGLMAQGGTIPYSWSLAAGSVPAGLALNVSTGGIMGTPTASGTSTFTVKITDSASPPQIATLPFTMIISPPTLKIATPPLPAGVVGLSYSGNFTAQGGTTPYNSWSLASGSLPAGLSLLASTGAIIGTPISEGNSTFTTKVTDSGSPAQVATQSFEISIIAGLTIISTSLPSGRAGLLYSATLNGQNGTRPYIWAIVSGSLPEGLNLNSDTGSITGTPTASGTFPFGVKLTDASTPIPQSDTEVTSLFVTSPVTEPVALLFTLKGIPQTAAPATNITNGTVQLNEPSLTSLNATVTITLNPSEAGLPVGYLGDAGFVDSIGNKSPTANLFLPSFTTNVPLPTFDPGTVAGDITVSLAVAGQSVADSMSRIEPSAPIIEGTSVLITNVTANGFDVEMVATSTPRDLTVASFAFSPAPGSNISGENTFTVDVSSMMTEWFASSGGLSYGGAFSITIPFVLSGSATAIQAVSVTLTNSVGTSAPVKGTL